MYSHGVFIGRFQPFHIGHLSVVRAILASCEHLSIIVGSSDQARTPHNPWTYEERRGIIRETLAPSEWSHCTIVPLPDDASDEVWADHLFQIVPSGSIIFTGNPWVASLLDQRGITYQWILPIYHISATTIRALLTSGEDVSEWTRVRSLPEGGEL